MPPHLERIEWEQVLNTLEADALNRAAIPSQPAALQEQQLHGQQAATSQPLGPAKQKNVFKRLFRKCKHESGVLYVLHMDEQLHTQLL
jgi:prolyl-tRNA editing enzyme YbaK/EbsC (Cys-tRNA(Pro) deacylase)